MAGLLETSPSKSLLDVGNTGPINFGALTGVDIPATNFDLINVKQPSPFKVNPIVDSMARNPKETKDAIASLALAIPQAFARFAQSTGEAVVRLPAGLYANTNLPGSDIAAKIATAVVPPARVPGLGLLGETQSYESKAAAGQGLGQTTFDIATDEPLGLAFKPLAAVAGIIGKNFFGKGVKGAIEEQKQMISFLEDATKNHRAKALLKYFGSKSPEDHSLDELLVQAQGTAKKSASLDSRVTELGFKDMDEAQRELERYVQMRKD